MTKHKAVTKLHNSNWETDFRGLGLPKNVEHDGWTQPYFQP